LIEVYLHSAPMRFPSSIAECCSVSENCWKKFVEHLSHSKSDYFIANNAAYAKTPYVFCQYSS